MAYIFIFVAGASIEPSKTRFKPLYPFSVSSKDKSSQKIINLKGSSLITSEISISSSKSSLSISITLNPSFLYSFNNALIKEDFPVPLAPQVKHYLKDYRLKISLYFL